MAKAKLFHVHCHLPNASKHISGVDFVEHDEHVRSADPVKAEVADRFRGIKGYHIVADGAPAPAAAPEGDDDNDDGGVADDGKNLDPNAKPSGNDPAKLL